MLLTGPTRAYNHDEYSGTELVSTLAQLLPQTPGKVFIRLNGAFEIEFPNKEIGAWMTSRRNLQLAAKLQNRNTNDRPAASDLIQDCPTTEDAAAQIMETRFFQVYVHDDPLVTQRDSLGVVLPVFSTPVQAISFLKDIVWEGRVDPSKPAPSITMKDVSIRPTSGAKVCVPTARRLSLCLRLCLPRRTFAFSVLMDTHVVDCVT